jgi:3-dehydroquinate dehydratase II
LSTIEDDGGPKSQGYGVDIVLTIAGSGRPLSVAGISAFERVSGTHRMSRLIYILNGPNLNLLGKRQPHIYGHETLADVEAACLKVAQAHGLAILFHQSNREYEIIDWIHEARETAAGIVINPGAFTHTSVAILDALNTFEPPVIEVHISNVHKREAFRHHSYVSLRADGVIAGLGTQGYSLAVERLASLIKAAKA